MDNYFKSISSPDYLVFIINTIRETLSNAGFKTKKWMSNSQELLDSFPKSESNVNPKLENKTLVTVPTRR